MPSTLASLAVIASGLSLLPTAALGSALPPWNPSANVAENNLTACQDNMTSCNFALSRTSDALTMCQESAAHGWQHTTAFLEPRRKDCEAQIKQCYGELDRAHTNLAACGAQRPGQEDALGDCKNRLAACEAKDEAEENMPQKRDVLAPSCLRAEAALKAQLQRATAERDAMSEQLSTLQKKYDALASSSGQANTATKLERRSGKDAMYRQLQNSLGASEAAAAACNSAASRDKKYGQDTAAELSGCQAKLDRVKKLYQDQVGTARNSSKNNEMYASVCQTQLVEAYHDGCDQLKDWADKLSGEAHARAEDFAVENTRLQEELEAAEADLTDVRAQLSDTKQDLATSNEKNFQLTEIKAKYDAVQKQLEKCQSDLGYLQGEAPDLHEDKGECLQIKQDLRICEMDRSALRQHKTDDAHTDTKEAHGQGKVEGICDAEKTELEVTKKTLSTCQADLSGAKADSSSLKETKGECSVRTHDLDTCKADLSGAKADLSSLKESKGECAVRAQDLDTCKTDKAALQKSLESKVETTKGCDAQTIDLTNTRISLADAKAKLESCNSAKQVSDVSSTKLTGDLESCKATVAQNTGLQAKLDSCNSAKDSCTSAKATAESSLTIANNNLETCKKTLEEHTKCSTKNAGGVEMTWAC